MIDIYINSKGDDSSGDGSSVKPYRTWAKAISMVNDHCNIYFGEGIFSVSSLVDMSLTPYKINYFGYGYSTVIELDYYYEYYNGTFRNELTISNMVIRPCNAYRSVSPGDYRVISYTSDSVPVTFNYVLFTKSSNGSYPTACLFYLHNNSAIQSNKVFNYCTFISPGTPAVQIGLATFKNCTTNVSSVGGGSITDCLVNQTYTADYRLASGDNKVYGPWSTWIGQTRMLMLINEKDYYTIKSGEVIKTDYSLNNCFVADDFIGLDKSKLITPFKFVLFKDTNDLNNYKTIKWKITNHNSFVLFDLSTIDMDNIKLKSDHLMLVSQDLKTWDNYYDGKMQSRINIANFANEIDNLKKYINVQSKPNDFIEKKYNYILMRLNSGESFDRLCETLYADYKRFDFESTVVYSSGIDKTIKVTPTFNANEIIVKILPKDSIVNKDSLGEL
jgi:hypothetical protein